MKHITGSLNAKNYLKLDALLRSCLFNANSAQYTSTPKTNRHQNINIIVTFYIKAFQKDILSSIGTYSLDLCGY